jgi:putative flippase GtrA
VLTEEKSLVMSEDKRRTQREGIALLLALARAGSAAPGGVAAEPMPAHPGWESPSQGSQRGRHRQPQASVAAVPLEIAHQHWVRFAVFGVIGGTVFVVSLAAQVALVRWLRVNPVLAYIIQGVFSIQLSFMLNRYITWRDRDVPFWRACLRFNAQNFVMSVLRIVAYAGIVKLGIEYIAANVLITAAFTPINYVAGHRWSFARNASGDSSLDISQAPDTRLAVRAPDLAVEVGRARGVTRLGHRVPLLAILAVQSVLSLRLVWSNTAFQDEAQYLWIGHLEWAHWLHGAPAPTLSLSGAQVVYPPLGALADALGGLAGARLLSLGFMLMATLLLYATGSRLFDQRTGLLAAALFVTAGPTADLGAWATYDPMAIFLLAFSAWLAFRAEGRASELWIFCSALTMVLADAAKWASALWNPVIIALVVLTAKLDWRLAAARGVRLLSYAIAIATPALFVFGGKFYLYQVTSSTVQRTAEGTPPLMVLWAAAPFVAVILSLATLAVVLSRKESGRRRALCTVLAIAVLLAPAVEAHDHTIVALYKHVIFGAWFGAIAAGYALSKASAVNAAKGWRVGLAAAIFCGLLGYGQASGEFGYWPNSSRLIAAMERFLPRHSPVLMQDGDAFVGDYYLLRHGVHSDIITSYGRSTSALSAMIKDGYFGLIETETGIGVPKSSIQLSLQDVPGGLTGAGYREVARIPWWDSDGAYGVYALWQSAPRTRSGH